MSEPHTCPACLGTGMGMPDSGCGEPGKLISATARYEVEKRDSAVHIFAQVAESVPLLTPWSEAHPSIVATDYHCVGKDGDRIFIVEIRYGKIPA